MKFFASHKFKLILTILGLFFVNFAFADKGLGDIATKMTDAIASVGKLMTAIAYLAGFGFLVFGVLKFKQHKDNPSQVTLGTPVVMVIIGAVLVFIGGFVAPLGETFGFEKTQVGGFSGSGVEQMAGGSKKGS